MGSSRPFRVRTRAAAWILGGALVASASAQDSLSTVAPPRTFAVETYVDRAFHYLDAMTDADGLPYFNVFWTEPAEAAHDWPDFGDVTTRQLQAAVMARKLTGRTAKHEALWLRQTLARLDPETGLLRRPKKSFCEPTIDPGDQALTLYALVTVYADRPDPAIKDAVDKMIAHLPALYEKSGGWVNGFGIKGLTTWARLTGSRPALDLAGKLVTGCFETAPLFTPDNTFRQGGHMHGNLRTLVGAADYALMTRDPVLYSRVDAIYRYVRSEATSFGFIPEVIGRKGDVVACETCALMDYLGLAVTLANHGHPEYWGDVERTLRNQLVESQVVDPSWLPGPKNPAGKPDTEQFTWREVGARMVGGYAGWSSPTHILAAREDLHWGGPELRGKTRAFQNCCGGSGTHAFFIAWKNAARVENGTLSVNLLIDKQLPEAEIRSFQPYQGRLTITLKKPLNVRVRIPDFTTPAEVKVQAGAAAIAGRPWGNSLELGTRPAGERLEITFPLPIRDEECVIGNPGFRHYRYRATWKGDTVVAMTPLDPPTPTGFSDFDNKPVAVFYGVEGPGPLYQRAQLRNDHRDPAVSPLHQDDGSLDFWK